MVPLGLESVLKLILFISIQICLMVKEHVIANHPKTRTSEKSHQLSRHYHNLLRQSGTLKKQLDEVGIKKKNEISHNFY